MKVRPLALCLLPGMLIAASMVTCFVGIFLELRFTDVIDPTSHIVLYAILFAVTFVLIGFGLCRGMTKYEVVAAASIYVGIQLLLYLILMFTTLDDLLLGVIYYGGFAYNRCFIDALRAISGNELVALLGVFSTYLFVLFGKEQEEQSE